jgi:hypothetical protein
MSGPESFEPMDPRRLHPAECESVDGCNRTVPEVSGRTGPDGPVERPSGGRTWPSEAAAQLPIRLDRLRPITKYRAELVMLAALAIRHRCLLPRT